jgi:hypothetical protein
MMDSNEDPKDGHAVAVTVFSAVLVYAVCCSFVQRYHEIVELIDPRDSLCSVVFKLFFTTAIIGGAR